MPFRYSPLSSSTVQERELEATFATEDSDIEEGSVEQAEESRLLSQEGPGITYNFENLDYDYPPPGSPPGPSTSAIPDNLIGNSNGQIPSSSPQYPTLRRVGLLQRATQAVFPSFRDGPHKQHPIGGGIENDGVFANLNAKPSPGRAIRDGDSGIYVVPEEVQREAPPSYASAQADAAPPYWETTILAPASFGGPGEIMVDGLPTGSFFSFLWNFLVSMSFQFVGFLLTFLLHSTHAAKLGSRAGLGITLIHYGFYLRTRTDIFSSDFFSSGSNDESTWWSSPTSTTEEDRPLGTGIVMPTSTKATASLNDSATDVSGSPIAEDSSEWLSFLLMTAGWFILLTSIMAFWRVKRWERSVIASSPPTEDSDTNPPQTVNPLAFLYRNIGFPRASWRGRNEPPREDEEAAFRSSEVPANSFSATSHLDGSPEREVEIRAHAEIARLQQERLQQTFRDAGLIL